MTSSPGFSRRSPSFGEVNALRATRLAEEPEFTREVDRTPTNRASLRSNSLAKRPVVNQPSSAESTTEQTSSGPITLPDTGTVEVPETNSLWGKASAWNSAVRAKICLRNCSARSVIDIRILKASRANSKCNAGRAQSVVSDGEEGTGAGYTGAGSWEPSPLPPAMRQSDAAPDVGINGADHLD